MKRVVIQCTIAAFFDTTRADEGREKDERRRGNEETRRRGDEETRKTRGVE